MNIKIKVDKNFDISKISELVEDELKLALEEAAITIHSAATLLCPVDLGNLRGSLSYSVDGGPTEGTSAPADAKDGVDQSKPLEALIGTNVEYAPYVEFGTGIYATQGSNAKKIPWYYKDEMGKWHKTSGQKAQPFLRPALDVSENKIKNIFKKRIEKALNK